MIMKFKFKNKEVYLLAFMMPILLFGLAALFSQRLPFFSGIYQLADARMQYPGFFMELVTRIKEGGLYSLNGGLGFNFFGIFTYYLCSPLNLLVFLFDAKTLPLFFTLVIYLRLGLSGVTMAIYLNHQEKKEPIWIITFATIFALMGFSGLYFYNIMWFDSVIMLPLILLGLDKLIKTGRPYFYIITLSLGIIFNYYIGFMICIFSVIYFIYKLLATKTSKLKEYVIKFLLSSLVVGAIAAVIILPSYYALMNGKASMFGYVWHGENGLTINALGFFNQLLPGSYKPDDFKFGPASLYSSLLAVLLVILFFFNKKFKKKEKIVVASILLFYYLSFSISLLDHAWQLFQRPIWWQSRYSFTFSTFLILIAFRNLMHLDNIKLKKITKFSIFMGFFVLSTASFIYILRQYEGQTLLSFYIFFIISLILFLEYLLVIEKKPKFILFLLILELTLNTYNGLSLTRDMLTYPKLYEQVSTNEKTIEKLKAYDTSFYRLEFVTRNTSNDGLLLNYHGVNFFSSTYNYRMNHFLQETLSLTNDNIAILKMEDLNPILLSMLNIKYLIGDLDYYSKIEVHAPQSVYENKHPLALGFMFPESPKVSFAPRDSNANYEKLYSLFAGKETSLFEEIAFKKIIFKQENIINSDSMMIKDGKIGDVYSLGAQQESGFLKAKYQAKNDCLMMDINAFNNLTEVLVNGSPEQITAHNYIYLKKGDKVELRYQLNSQNNLIEKDFIIFNIENYEIASTEIASNLLKVNNASQHLIEGVVESTKEKNILFLSIPYEKGFNIKVDGKKTEPIILFDAFLGLKLSEGIHQITIDYVPPGLILGLCLTLGANGAVIFYYLWERRTRKRT